MKVLAIACLTLAVVSAGRSGPYLPSGWRPSGPAFLLPGEIEKPSDNPLKETIQVEPEGSDSLREYGPPNIQEISQDLTSQDLPNVIVENSFSEVRSNDIVETADIREIFEVTTEAVIENRVVEDETTIIVEVVTETSVQEAQNDESVDLKAITETITSNTESSVVEKADMVEAVPENDNANSNIVTAVEEREKTVVEVEEREGKSVEAEVVSVEAAVQGVNNIEEALVNLENEIKTQQATSDESAVVVKTSQQNTESLAPEGFLEYGPPGFREYGPPKELLRSGNVQDEAVEANETRRRRFSPKVRLTKRANH